MACVALPSCGQSLAEGERVRQPILQQLERELERLDLLGERLALFRAGDGFAGQRDVQDEGIEITAGRGEAAAFFDQELGQGGAA